MIELIKFQMPNCGPCKVVQVGLDRLKDQYGDRVAFTVVDASVELERAQALGIMKAPTCVLFKDGVEVQRFEGAKHRYSEYVTALESQLEEK